MNKLIFLLVALLAALASVSAQVTPSVSASFSSSVPPSLSTSVSASFSNSVSASFSNSLSNSISSSLSSSVSTSFSNSLSNSVSVSLSSSVSTSFTATVSVSLTNTPTTTKSQSRTPTSSSTMTPTGTGTVTNTMSGTQSHTQSGSISSSFSASVSAPPSITASVTAAPAPTSLTQVTTGCGNSRKVLCVSWSRPEGVPALAYLVTATAQVSGQKWTQNFTNGENFAMFMGLQPSTAYVITVQTLYLGTLSTPATLTITTNAPSPKQMPSLGITGFSCRSAVSTTQKKKRNIICSWTNGSVAYTIINLRIKCTGKKGSAFDGKNRNVRTFIKAGASSNTEMGFFPNARCKIIMNPAYATGPGRRVVQTIEVV